MTRSSDIVVVDAGPFLARSSSRRAEALAIRHACRDCGFFYISGHGVPDTLLARLEHQSQAFFALPLEQKLAIRMARGGRAWRGYFPIGGELTSGKPDQKEGLYFGAELADDHPKVAARTPLHGRNLFPDEIPGFRETVLEYIDAATRIGHALMEGVALSLGLDESYFDARYTRDPLVLFRIFRYPPRAAAPDDETWGVGEHTDYGLLTILRQDAVGGLQVKSRARLDRRAAAAGHVHLQHRRHARSHDERFLSIDAAPRAESERTRAALVAVFLRSGL